MGTITTATSLTLAVPQNVSGSVKTTSQTDFEAGQTLPHDLTFTEGHLLTIIVYAVLILISAAGNGIVLTVMWRRRRKARARINLMLMHLAIADLLVGYYLCSNIFN